MTISEKIHIPRVRHSLVPRHGLMSKLDEGLNVKLTLVSSHAGYGKTTALSEWVKQINPLSAWISLDEKDNDFHQLWHYITMSIAEKVPGFGQSIQPLLEKGVSDSWEPVISAILNELRLLQQDLVIILDDYHTIDLPLIHESMHYLIEYLPPHIHLYIISRTGLAFPTARLLVQGEFILIEQQDMRFQLDEGIAFFRDTTDLHLTEDQVTHLHHQTEGWISGLKLVALSLRNSRNLEESIQQLSGHHQNIADYLLEEVFQQQSESMRSFLLETSILRRMNHNLCVAVTGQIQAQTMLETLEKLNLFVIPLDDRRDWYRYHHMFSEFLQRLFAQNDSDKWMQTHIRAATWLERQGYEEEAMEHFLAGKQYADVMRLMEKILPSLALSRRETANKWMMMLPKQLYAEKPMLELLSISVLISSNDWQTTAQSVKQALIKFPALKGTMSDHDWNHLMSNLYFLAALLPAMLKDWQKCIEFFELIERHTPEGCFYQSIWCDRYQGYDTIDDHTGFNSDIRAVEHFLTTCVQKWTEKKGFHFVGHMHASYSKFLYERNQLEEAERQANYPLVNAEMHPYMRIQTHSTVSAAKIQQAKGNPHRAMELLEHLKKQIKSPDYPLFLRKIEAEQAYIAVLEGWMPLAEDWLQTCGLNHTDEIGVHTLVEYMVLTRVLAASGHLENALALSERLYPFVSKMDRRRDQIKVGIMQSTIYWRMGRLEEALDTLELALKLAEPMGYARSFIDEGPIMADLLTAYAKGKKGSHKANSLSVSADYVRGLLLAMNIPLSDGNQVLTEQEKRIVSLLANGLANKEIAHHLNIKGETVKSHMKNIFQKLDASNRVQAVQRAKDLKIIE